MLLALTCLVHTNARSNTPLPTVLRLDLSASQADQVRALPEAVVVLKAQEHEDDVQGLMAALSGAAKLPRQAFQQGHALMLLSSGPMLDQPDRVSVQKLVIEHMQINLVVKHTRVRDAGMSLERNLPWRPLVKVRIPSDLAAGTYTVHVRWIVGASDGEGDGAGAKRLPTHPPSVEQTTSFELRQ